MVSTYPIKTEKWLQNVGSNPDAQLRLFCLAYAGGSASIFRSWADYLPPTVEVCPIQLPGRENRYREAPFTNFAALIDNLKQILQPYLNLPFAFLGHSLGGLIAFELARAVEQNPLIASRLQRLFVSGVRAPQFSSSEATTYALPRADFIERLRKMGGTPEEVLGNEELLDLLLPVVRADFQLLASYTYQAGPSLNCPISVFAGEQDLQISQLQLEGWQTQTRQATTFKVFAGNHFFINSTKRAVLQELKQQLASGLV